LYSEKDGLGLGELARQGKISPLELLEKAIRHIETLNPQINPVIHTMYDQARTTG